MTMHQTRKMKSTHVVSGGSSLVSSGSQSWAIDSDLREGGGSGTQNPGFLRITWTTANGYNFDDGVLGETAKFYGKKIGVLPKIGAAVGVLRGLEASARTVLPVVNRAVVIFRWGFRFPKGEPTASGFSVRWFLTEQFSVAGDGSIRRTEREREGKSGEEGGDLRTLLWERRKKWVANLRIVFFVGIENLTFFDWIFIISQEIQKNMVERFFSVPQTHFPRPHSQPILLLSGPPSSGKTSLLFQFAFNAALGSDSINGNVVFICNRSRLESKPPFLSQGIDPSNDVFERVQMKYVDSDEGIKKYFAAFHLHDNIPRMVVIDDFGDLFDDRNCQERYSNARGRDLAMVRTLALCHSAITHANKKGPCNLLLSDTHHGDSPRLLFIYKRWTSSVYTIRGDGSGSFLLKNYTYSGKSLSERTRTAKYSIALQYLVLNVITEDGES